MCPSPGRRRCWPRCWAGTSSSASATWRRSWPRCGRAAGAPAARGRARGPGGPVGRGVGNVAEILAAMREGRVRALGQAAERRWEEAPDVPTFREQGFDMVAGSARGIAGPPRLPAPVRAKLEQAFAAALADPAFLRAAQRA